MRNTDPELIPVFVAKDLFKLLAVDLDHVDVSRLQNSIKESYVTIDQLEEVKWAYVECKYLCVNTGNVSNKDFVTVDRLG